MEIIAYSVALILFLALVYWKGKKTIFNHIDSHISQLTKDIEEAKKLKDATYRELADTRELIRVRKEELITLLDSTALKSEFMKKEFEESTRINTELKSNAMKKRIQQMQVRLENQFRQQVLNLSIDTVYYAVMNSQNTVTSDNQRRINLFTLKN